MMRLRDYILSFWKDDILDTDFSEQFYHKGERVEEFLEKNLREGEYAILRFRNYTLYYLKKENVFLYDKHVLLKDVIFSLKNRVSYFDAKDFLDKNPELKCLQIILGRKPILGPTSQRDS